MTKIATPISHLFEDKETASEIIKISDCLECRDWAVDSDFPGQELAHLEATLIWQWSEEEKEFIKELISKKPELKLLTFHLSSCYHMPPIKERMFQPEGRLYSEEEMLRNARENTSFLRQFAKSKIIGVENNNYLPTPAYDIVTDGDFIKKIVTENDLTFLFDIAHAKISSHNQRVSYEDYLATLPLEKAVQLHICKSGLDERGTAIDIHEAPDEDVYREVRRLTENFPIKYLTIEYYKNPEILIKKIKELGSIRPHKNL
ncbi:DUF692 family protein [Candidatus Pacearchaeota archaeon]|nr:DUF692 family protein [Candidatus Pacearchaeota archaeon]